MSILRGLDYIGRYRRGDYQAVIFPYEKLRIIRDLVKIDVFRFTDHFHDCLPVHARLVEFFLCYQQRALRLAFRKSRLPEFCRGHF